MRHLLLMLLTILASVPVQAQGGMEDAAAAVRNMKIGWNLGNTLDSHRNGVTSVFATETMRGQPVTRPELMEMMKIAGFNTIRVPVTWYPHLDDDGNIDEAWMSRVQEVVDYVIDQGMYCIVNVHHDTGRTDPSGTTSKGWLRADINNYNANKELFERIWRQIATRFKDYGQELIFEGYNEMTDRIDSQIYASFAAEKKYNEALADSAYRAINLYAKSFVTAVRGTGGNNALRNLIVNTYMTCDGRGTWSSHIVDPLVSMEKPEQSDHIIFGVHSYPPIVTTTDDVTEELTMEFLEDNIDGMIDNLDTYFIQRYNSPVIISEWGTAGVDDALTDYDLHREHMFEFVDCFVKKAKAKDIATLYWMGLSNTGSRGIPAFNQPELAERILKAYYGDEYMPTILTADDYNFFYDISFTKQWAEVRLAEDETDLATDYSGLEVVLAETPGNSGNLSFRAYKTSSSETSTTADYVNLSNITSTTSTLNFGSVSLSPIKHVTITWRSSGTAALKVAHVYLIKKSGEKVEVKPTRKNGSTVTSTWAPQFIKCELGDLMHGTLYSSGSVIVPPGVTATAYKVEDDALQAVATYGGGDVIPGGTGVVVNAAQRGVFKFSLTGQSGTAATGSMLRGSDEDALTTGGDKYYRLALGETGGTEMLGFYYVGDDGAAFTNTGGEAYLALPGSVAWSPQYPLCETPLPVDAEHFPDTNFRNYVTSTLTYQVGGNNIYPGKDGKLIYNEIAKITELSCSSLFIGSLEGIEHLPALMRLTCNDNKLTSLDVSQNPALTILNCSNNQLTSLDVSQNANLEMMWCSNNRLTSLDVSNNPALFELWAVGMKTLESLDVSNNLALKRLYCRDNAFTGLDMSKNAALEVLQCFGNKIATLDLTANTKLKEVNCRSNGMAALSLPATTSLYSVNCMSNRLTELDVSVCPELTLLQCNDNSLTALDLSANKKLKTLNYSGQSRDIDAQSAKVRVDDQGETRYEKYYYLRLDGNATGSVEADIWQSMTATNYDQAATTFALDRVAWTGGGSVINGTRKQAAAGDVTPASVYGQILLLTDVTEADGMASGAVTYTYDVRLPEAAPATDPQSAFTLNWTADASPDVVTGVDTPGADARVLAVVYTDMTGRVSDRPFRGVNMVTTHYSDGTTRVAKMLLR